MVQKKVQLENGSEGEEMGAVGRDWVRNGFLHPKKKKKTKQIRF